MLELGTDYHTHSFDKYISIKIFSLLEQKTCKFCNSELDADKAGFYQHEGGWNVQNIKEKIWIWFTCKKCHHQWSINHLGIKRNALIIWDAEESISKNCSICSKEFEVDPFHPKQEFCWDCIERDHKITTIENIIINNVFSEIARSDLGEHFLDRITRSAKKIMELI